MSRKKASSRLKNAQYYPKSELGITSFAGPRGGIQLMWKNHRYVCDSKKKNHRVYTCSSKRQGCRARIYVNSVKGSPKYGFCWVKNSLHECEEREIAPPTSADTPRRKTTRSSSRKKMKRTPSPPISNPSIPLERQIKEEDPDSPYMDDEDDEYDGPVVPQFEPSEDVHGNSNPRELEYIEPRTLMGISVEGVYPPKVDSFGMTLRVFMTFPHEMPVPHEDDVQIMLSNPSFSLTLHNTTSIRERQNLISNRPILYVRRSVEGRKIGYVRSNLEIGVSLPFEQYPGVLDEVSVHVCLMVQNRRFRLCKQNAMSITTRRPEEDPNRRRKRRRLDRDSPQSREPILPQNNPFNHHEMMNSDNFFINSIPPIHELPRQPPPAMYSSNDSMLMTMTSSNHHESDDYHQNQAVMCSSSSMFQHSHRVPLPPPPPPVPMMAMAMNTMNNKSRNSNNTAISNLTVAPPPPPNLNELSNNFENNENMMHCGVQEIVVVHPAEGSIAGNEYVEIFFNDGSQNTRHIAEHVRFYFDGMYAPILNVQNARFYGSNLERSDQYKYRVATEDSRFVAVVKTPPRDREGFVDIEMKGNGGEVLYRLQNGYQYVDMYGRKKEKKNRKSTEKVGRTGDGGWEEFLEKSSLLGGPNGDDLFWEEDDSLGLLTQDSSRPDVDEILDWGNWATSLSYQQQQQMVMSLMQCVLQCCTVAQFMMIEESKRTTNNNNNNMENYVDFKNLNQILCL